MIIQPVDIKFKQESLDKFNGVMRAYVTELNQEVQKTMVQSAKALTEQLMEETPPYVKEKGNNTLEAKKVGERAIRLNLMKSVTPINDVFGGEVKNKNVRKIIKRKDYKAMQDVFDNSTGKMKRWKVKTFEPALHTLGNRKKKFVATFETKRWNDYLKILQSRVGYMKAGWGYTIRALGGSVPAWIGRCIPFTKGGMESKFDGDKSFIKFWNGTPTIKKFEGRFNNAIDRLTERMLQSLKIKMEYISKKNQGR